MKLDILILKAEQHQFIGLSSKKYFLFIATLSYLILFRTVKLLGADIHKKKKPCYWDLAFLLYISNDHTTKYLYTNNEKKIQTTISIKWSSMMHIANHPMTIPVYILIRLLRWVSKMDAAIKPRGNLKTIVFS